MCDVQRMDSPARGDSLGTEHMLGLSRPQVQCPRLYFLIMLRRLLDCCNTNPITFKIINLCTYQKGKECHPGSYHFSGWLYAHFALSTVDRLRGEFSVCHDKEDDGNGNGSCLPSGGIFSSCSCSLFPFSHALGKAGKKFNMIGTFFRSRTIFSHFCHFIMDLSSISIISYFYCNILLYLTRIFPSA